MQTRPYNGKEPTLMLLVLQSLENLWAPFYHTSSSISTQWEVPLITFQASYPNYGNTWEEPRSTNKSTYENQNYKIMTYSINGTTIISNNQVGRVTSRISLSLRQLKHEKYAEFWNNHNSPSPHLTLVRNTWFYMWISMSNYTMLEPLIEWKILKERNIVHNVYVSSGISFCALSR